LSRLEQQAANWRRFSDFIVYKTKGFFCFSFNKRPPKDATWKTELFAYTISRKRIANHQNQLQNDVFHVKSIQSAEKSSIMQCQKMKIGQKTNIRPFCTKAFN